MLIKSNMLAKMIDLFMTASPELCKMNVLHKLGDVNAKDQQYENPAAAGPKKKSKAKTPEKTSCLEVVRISKPKANMKIIINQRGI